MAPRSGHSKTAPAAVLHGSMFPKPCASAQGRVQCTRAAAHAAALRLLYHDAATQPQQNRTCCGFAWFSVLKALCASTGAVSYTHLDVYKRQPVEKGLKPYGEEMDDTLKTERERQNA